MFGILALGCCMGQEGSHFFSCEFCFPCNVPCLYPPFSYILSTSSFLSFARHLSQIPYISQTRCRVLPLPRSFVRPPLYLVCVTPFFPYQFLSLSPLWGLCLSLDGILCLLYLCVVQGPMWLSVRLWVLLFLVLTVSLCTLLVVRAQ